MGRIVTVNVVDLTRPVEQKGFKSVMLLDLEAAADVEAKLITSASEVDNGISASGKKAVNSFFANGGSSLLVRGKKVNSSEDITTDLNALSSSHDFYGVIAVIQKSNQASYLEKIKEFVDGNRKLAIVEINGTETILATENTGTIAKIANSDRVVAFANSNDSQSGIAGAVSGACFPQDEGSITWGNKVVIGVIESKYSLADEAKLLNNNINYITKEKGLVITQFGRTTSGSNADITRSKDWLENRCAESLTSTLVNNKKVPFTAPGMAMISSSLNQVGVQAVNMGMLDSFMVLTPNVSEIPTNDKANRVLKGVKFIATLSGAVETIEMELQVKL